MKNPAIILVVYLVLIKHQFECYSLFLHGNNHNEYNSDSLEATNHKNQLKSKMQSENPGSLSASLRSLIGPNSKEFYYLLNKYRHRPYSLTSNQNKYIYI